MMTTLVTMTGAPLLLTTSADGPDAQSEQPATWSCLTTTKTMICRRGRNKLNRAPQNKKASKKELQMRRMGDQGILKPNQNQSQNQLQQNKRSQKPSTGPRRRLQLLLPQNRLDVPPGAELPRLTRRWMLPTIDAPPSHGWEKKKYLLLFISAVPAAI